ncbi:hypothetical protein SALWKB2_0375 [Snodgrassella alvi wkB2]|nr:hypothetical protein SALWKB2_0375 [Snodgrassella alvi wkB2]
MLGLFQPQIIGLLHFFLPDISVDFGSPISQASIILTAYLVPYGVLQPFYGFYSDWYGCK